MASPYPLRILHAPSIVGNNPPTLARAERTLGLASHCVAFYEARGYQADEVICKDTGSKLDLVKAEAKRLGLLWRALRDFDVIHFNFGRTIFPTQITMSTERFNPVVLRLYNAYAGPLELRDMPLLKAAGKGLLVTYQGDDARQGDYCLANYAVSMAQEVEPGYYTPEADAHKREKLAYVARYADRMYALNPDLVNVMPSGARFLPYASVDLADWPYSPKPIGQPDIPVVLHAPTHRLAKGTRFLFEAVERLQGEGVPFEFHLVEGLTHKEARALYMRADLLVDQLLAGWYGGLAVELMALGKPVICYLREGDLHHLPAGMRADLPLIQADPKTIYQVLKDWLTTRRHEIPAQGERSRRFVETWHDPLAIAADLKVEYETIMAAKRTW